VSGAADRGRLARRHTRQQPGPQCMRARLTCLQVMSLLVPAPPPTSWPRRF